MSLRALALLCVGWSAAAAAQAPAVDAGAPDAGVEAPAVDAGAPAAAPAELEEFAPVESSASSAPAVETFSSAPAGPVTRVYGQARALMGVDTSFDSAEPGPLSEHVFELHGRLKLGVDVKLSESLRVVAEARAFWRAGAQAGLARAKGTFEPYVGEAFVDLYSSVADLRVGNQVLAFGANPALAPADALNPRDLREGLLLGEPEDAKLPVLAIRAAGSAGKVQWTAVYVPFFVPHRYDVFGQDQALVQPALETVAELPSQLDVSVEDLLQPHLLETERPKDFGWLGDLGLRATTRLGPATVGLSWVYQHEKLPQLTVDEELSTFARKHEAGIDDPALLGSLHYRIESGERLVTGRYERNHLLSLEGSFLAGPAQVDLDLTYSPAQTFYELSGAPLRKPSVTWVVGVTQAEDSKLVYSVSYLGMAIPDVLPEELIVLLEPTTARGAARTAWLHLFVGSVAYKLFDDRVELSLRAAFEPIQRSFAVAPKVAWTPFDRLSVFVGAEIFQGPVLSPFGYVNRNDQLLVGVSGELF